MVANVGHAFETNWDEGAAALLLAWYPGEGFGPALAQVLVGDREPGGRMPVSIGHQDGDYPAFALKPQANGDLPYAEGLGIGYRGMETARHAFGSGRGYAEIAWISASISGEEGDAMLVEVVVENRSTRAGTDVLQIYRRSPGLALVGFAKAHLAPGERTSITIPIPRRRLQYWQDGWRDIAEPYLFLGRSAVDVAFPL